MAGGRHVIDLAARVDAMPRSGIREVMELAERVPEIIHLEVGEPDFPTPPHVVEAAARAARDGYTKYTPSRGFLSLREALAAKLAERNRMVVSPDDIVVTTGGVTAVLEAILLLVDPGAAVLLPDPGWPNTEAMVALAGGRPVRYPLDPGAAFAPDLEALGRIARREGARVVYVNSPSNPTGAVFGPAVVERLCNLAGEIGFWIVSDECYESITFGQPHLSPGAFAPERTFAAFSFSKTYSMTGWRVGYLVTPPGLGAMAAKVQEPLVSCAAAISQKAAEAALTGPQDDAEAMVTAFRERRDLAVGLLEPSGLLLARPEGAFYALVDVTPSGRPSRDYARDLVAERGVAVAPGDTFGPSTAGAVRLSFAVNGHALGAGIARLLDDLEGKGR